MIKIESPCGIKGVFKESVKKDPPDFFNEEEAKKSHRFHRTIKGYSPTPLIELDALALKLGVRKIFVKDESHRFGLNAFKALGATYAIAKLLCRELECHINHVDFDYFMRPEIAKRIKSSVFVTATDGNHGRAVAWAANRLGCRSIVYLPKGSSKKRLHDIQNEGAEASITDVNYDDSVRLAYEKAKAIGGFMVQDTAWEGYEDIPKWISQGYTTLAVEIFEQFKTGKMKKPTHLFLQAGVGSFAGGILGYFSNVFKEDPPKTAIIEPEEANCIYKSVLINDQHPHAVKGDLNTIMAGLACGEPNTITWETLRDFSSAYFSCSDDVAKEGMKILAKPEGDDPKIVSGESGAVGVGLLSLLMQRDDLSKMKEKFSLDENSIVLLISTEGDTDPEHYRKVISE